MIRTPSIDAHFRGANFFLISWTRLGLHGRDIELFNLDEDRRHGQQISTCFTTFLRARTRKIVVISSDIVDIVLKHVHTPQVELHPPETPGMVTWWQVNLLRTVVRCFVCFLKFPARFSNLRRCFQTRILTPSVLDMVQL